MTAPLFVGPPFLVGRSSANVFYPAGTGLLPSMDVWALTFKLVFWDVSNGSFARIATEMRILTPDIFNSMTLVRSSSLYGEFVLPRSWLIFRNSLDVGHFASGPCFATGLLSGPGFAFRCLVRFHLLLLWMIHQILSRPTSGGQQNFLKN